MNKGLKPSSLFERQETWMRRELNPPCHLKTKQHNQELRRAQNTSSEGVFILEQGCWAQKHTDIGSVPCSVHVKGGLEKAREATRKVTVHKRSVCCQLCDISQPRTLAIISYSPKSGIADVCCFVYLLSHHLAPSLITSINQSPSVSQNRAWEHIVYWMVVIQPGINQPAWAISELVVRAVALHGWYKFFLFLIFRLDRTGRINCLKNYLVHFKFI